MKNKTEYMYNATVVNVVDGDTVDVVVDLGFKTFCKQRIRLLGIDAPEKRGASREEGIKSKEHLIELLARNNNHILLESFKTGKFGRWLGLLYLEGYTNSINSQMILDGHAKEYGS